MNNKTPNKQEPAFDEGYRKGFSDSMKYYVYDKINKKEAKHWFQDNEGNFYINVDPHGANMDGSFKVKMISNKFNNQQFEIRKRNFNNEHE